MSNFQAPFSPKEKAKEKKKTLRNFIPDFFFIIFYS
jgi:hypothetical protein